MAMAREQLLQQDAACRVFQARADAALETWGVRAPPPMSTDLPGYPEAYRRELLYMAKKRLPDGHDLRQVQVRHCPMDAFEIFEPQIYAACKEAGTRNDSVASGEERICERVNPQNGHRELTFLRRNSFIVDFKAPVRRVASFRIGQNFVDASGRGLR
jgi:hypothetical protein